VPYNPSFPWRKTQLGWKTSSHTCVTIQMWPKLQIPPPTVYPLTITKTPEHLLWCDTPNHHKIRQQFHLTFSKLCIEHAINPHLSQMWWLGMITANPTNHTTDLYPADYHPIFHSQTQIRWKQIYYGCISKQWTHYLTMNQPDLNPVQFYAQLIHQVWVYVLKLWTSQTLTKPPLPIDFPPTC